MKFPLNCEAYWLSLEHVTISQPQVAQREVVGIKMAVKSFKTTSHFPELSSPKKYLNLRALSYRNGNLPMLMLVSLPVMAPLGKLKENA